MRFLIRVHLCSSVVSLSEEVNDDYQIAEQIRRVHPYLL